MSATIDKKSNQILNYRPNIEFIEPEQKKVDINPIQKTPLLTQPKIDKIINLASTIEVLGSVIQNQIDEKCKNMKIKLDPTIDAAAIQAILRMFPEKVLDNNNQGNLYITYADYKECRNKISEYAEELAKKASVSEKDISIARGKLDNTIVGGYGTEASKDGSLRPELSEKAQIIKPINVDEFQVDLIKILMNFLWKTFIRPPLAKIPFAGKVLPKQLPKLPKKQSAQLNNAKKIWC
jgi:hypothetical protein